jgi:tetratricopeptide (TPR) repeat protein
MSANDDSSSAMLALVDLPTLIQTISTQRRSGTLTVGHEKEQRRIYFSSGQIRAFCGPAPEIFVKALVWAEILRPDQREEIMRQLTAGYREAQVIEALQKNGLITRDGLLDTMDCYIEEGFAEMVGWTSPTINFVQGLSGDAWAQYQAKLGVNVAASTMLLEALRRQDEIKSFSAFIPDTWDVLVRDAGAIPPDLSNDEAALMAAMTENRSVYELGAITGMTAFRLSRGIVRLRQLGVLRLATPAEVTTHADRAYGDGAQSDAYHLYQRGLTLGVNNGRINLLVAELAENCGMQSSAARAFVIAADHLTDPDSAIVALKNALRLGHDQWTPLTQLLNIYKQTGNTREAIASLIQLAEYHEGNNLLDQAAQAVRDAQELGADAGMCATILARVAGREGDMEQAVLQLELAARAFHAQDRMLESANAYRQLSEILPGRCDYALEYARLLAGMDRNDEAAATLRKSLANQHGVSDEVLLRVYEMLAQVAPGDTQVHEWLVKAHQRTKNREGATEHLQLLAAAQEKEGDYPGLAETLEKILELGGDQVDILKRLALVYFCLGQERKANDTLCRGIDAAVALGHLKDARQLGVEAVEMDPSCLQLRIRLANIANREGDRGTAIFHYRAAVNLARGIGNMETARAMLIQVRKLRPDDLQVRIDLADIALELKDVNLDKILRELVYFAVRTNNFGLALERARSRVQLAGGLAYEPRMELVELLRRMGDNVNELKVGRELLNDLLEYGEFDKSIEFLQRMVAANPRNADLVLQLGEIFSSLGDVKQAQRFYKHAVSLLQIEGRNEEASKTLDGLEAMGFDSPSILMAREILGKGQALEWDAIRWSISQNQLRQMADQAEPK